MVAGLDARKLLSQQPRRRQELLHGRHSRQDLAAARSARARHAVLTLRARAVAGARSCTCTADTRSVHSRCTADAPQMHCRCCMVDAALQTHGACMPQVPPDELMQGAPVPAAALPPVASPAPPAVGAAALNLILSPSLMSSSQPRRRPPSPRRRAAPPRRRATSPRADASPRAGAPPTRTDAPTRSPPRRAARPGPPRR